MRCFCRHDETFRLIATQHRSSIPLTNNCSPYYREFCSFNPVHTRMLSNFFYRFSDQSLWRWSQTTSQNLYVLQVHSMACVQGMAGHCRVSQNGLIFNCILVALEQFYLRKLWGSLCIVFYKCSLLSYPVGVGPSVAPILNVKFFLVGKLLLCWQS